MSATAIKMTTRKYNPFRDGDYTDEVRYFVSQEAARLAVFGNDCGKLGEMEAYRAYYGGESHSTGSGEMQRVWVEGPDGSVRIVWTLEKITLEG